MAQPLEAAGGAPTVPVASTAPEDIFADELKSFGIEDDEPDDAAEAEPGDESDADEGDEPEVAEEDDTDEEPETPAIDPPVSWKAADKALFATLPPEAQRVIADRESERERVIQSKATEAADAKRATAQAEAAISQLNQDYAAQLSAFLQSDMPPVPDVALAESDPSEYVRQLAVYNAAYAQRAQASQQIEATNNWQAQQDAKAREAHAAEQGRILAEQIPEWSDPAARAALQTELSTLARAHGYTAEQLASADASDVMFLKTARDWKAKADKFDKLQAGKMAAVRAAKELPKVSRPGAAQERVPAADRRERAAMDQLRSGVKVHDPAALFEKYI